jgi:hypothetical protein
MSQNMFMSRLQYQRMIFCLIQVNREDNMGKCFVCSRMSGVGKKKYP